jgi:hypothetical protein
MARKRISVVRNVATTNCISQCAIILTTGVYCSAPLWNSLRRYDIQLTILLTCHFNSALALQLCDRGSHFGSISKCPTQREFNAILAAMLLWLHIHHLFLTNFARIAYMCIMICIRYPDVKSIERQTSLSLMSFDLAPFTALACAQTHVGSAHS